MSEAEQKIFLWATLQPSRLLKLPGAPLQLVFASLSKQVVRSRVCVTQLDWIYLQLLGSFKPEPTRCPGGTLAARAVNASQCPSA